MAPLMSTTKPKMPDRLKMLRDQLDAESAVTGKPAPPVQQRSSVPQKVAPVPQKPAVPAQRPILQRPPAVAQKPASAAGAPVTPQPMARPPMQATAPQAPQQTLTTMSTGTGPAPITGMPKMPTVQLPTLPTKVTPGTQTLPGTPFSDPAKRADAVGTVENSHLGNGGLAVDDPRAEPHVDEGTTSMNGEGTPQSMESMEEQFIRDLLGGANDVDTSEQEALVRELMQDKLGEQLVGQRASMGRAGFASSGALGAMESDAQRKAAQSASGEILDLRSGAKQDAIDNALKGIGADASLKGAAADEELMDMIFRLAESESAPPASAGGGGSGDERIHDTDGGDEPPDPAMVKNSADELPKNKQRAPDLDKPGYEAYRVTAGRGTLTFYVRKSGTGVVDPNSSAPSNPTAPEG